MDRFGPEQALELVERHRISHAFFVPTMFQRMLALPDHERFDVSSLRFVLHGAGPCTVDVKQRMFDWFGPVIHEIYAASEGPGTWITPDEWLAHRGSVGKVDPARIEIRDDSGAPVAADTEGVVWFAAAAPFAYHGDPEKTAATHDATGAWYTVGDRGRIDADGYLFLTGRSAEVIVAGGVNVYPARIDEVLQALPGVDDAAAFGLPDEELGEVVAAAVVAAGPTAGDLERRVVDACRAELGSQMTPRRVFVVDDLPRSDAGKLYRRRLVERFGDDG
jgi:long-chain acyl-CoA synthetase